MPDSLIFVIKYYFIPTLECMMNFIAITEKTVTLVVTDVYYKSTNVDVTNVFSKLILDSNLLSCKSQGVFQFTEQKIITTVISKCNDWTIL